MKPSRQIKKQQRVAKLKQKAAEWKKKKAINRTLPHEHSAGKETVRALP